FAVAKNFIHPANDVAGDIGEEFVLRSLICVNVVLQQLGIVIRHLLEMRDDPTLVNRITMEASGKLVVNTAARHLLESGGEDVLQMFSNVHVGTGALTRPAERSFAN